MNLWSAMAVGTGAALGALLRWLLQKYGLVFVPHVAFITLTINLLGSFLIGLLWPWLKDLQEPLRLFLSTGFLGGFTTFSAFSLETQLLWMEGHRDWSIFIVLISVIGGVLLCFLGRRLGVCLVT